MMELGNTSRQIAYFNPLTRIVYYLKLIKVKARLDVN